jgi:hypothetical protein
MQKIKTVRLSRKINKIKMEINLMYHYEYYKLITVARVLNETDTLRETGWTLI